MKKMLCMALTMVAIISRASAPAGTAPSAMDCLLSAIMPVDLIEYVVPYSVQVDQSGQCFFLWKEPSSIDQAKQWANILEQKRNKTGKMNDKLRYEALGLRYFATALAMENAQLRNDNAQLKAAVKQQEHELRNEQEGQKEAKEVAEIFMNVRTQLVAKTVSAVTAQPPAAASK